MPEPDFDPITRTYTTTAARVRLATIDPAGGFGELVVDIEPGETKTVTVNDKPVTIHRLRIV